MDGRGANECAQLRGMSRATTFGMGRCCDFRFALVSVVLSTLGCSRVAQVRPQEVQKLSGRLDRDVTVELMGGGHVAVRPDFSTVRLVPRDRTLYGDVVVRPPFGARVQGGALWVWDSGHQALGAQKSPSTTRAERVRSGRDSSSVPRRAP